MLLVKRQYRKNVFSKNHFITIIAILLIILSERTSRQHRQEN